MKTGNIQPNPVSPDLRVTSNINTARVIRTSINSACVSSNISDRVTCREEGDRGASSSSPRRQLTAEVLRVRPVAAQRGRAARARPAPACVFITERDPLKALLSLKMPAFLPTGELGGVRDLRWPYVKLTLQYRNT